MQPLAPDAVGIGLKSRHVDGLAAGDGALDFLEVHAENLMAPGGAARRAVQRLSGRHAVSLHGVGLSLGGAAPPDRAHLDRLAALVAELQPARVSEHLAWSGHPGRYLADLLPLPYTTATLARVAAHVDIAQQRLGRTLLVENPSTYLGFADSTLAEADFLAALVHRTGCGLLLDLANAFVSAVNHGPDATAPARARAFVDALPADAIGEIHLAGFAEDADADGARLLIDHHGAAVDAAVWALARHAFERLGPRPVLIERDHDIPPLAELAAEAHAARRLMHDSRRFAGLTPEASA